MASVRIVVNLGKGLSSREPGKTRTCATQFQVHHRTKLQPNCCFYHPLTWPLCVIPCFLCFASCSVAILNDTQDVIMHVIPIAGSDPTSLCFVWFGLVVVVCFWFAWFLLFLVVFFVWFLAGTARWTAYRSTTSTFVAIDK